MVEARANSPIDHLPLQKYHARVVYSFAGQNSGLRPFDAADREDMQRAWVLEGEQQKDFFTPENITQQQLVNWLKNRSHTQDYLIFGVAGNRGTRYGEGGKREVYPLSSEEQGEIQGWVYFDKFRSREVRKMVKAGIIPKPFPGQPVLQLQLVKLPGLPDSPTASGQMASAVRQAFACLAQLDYAFHADRIAREARDTGKTEEELWDLHPHKPTLLVVGTVSPRNPESMRVATASGQVLSPFGTGEGTIEGDVDLYYVVDWDILQRLMTEAALEERKTEAQGWPVNTQVIQIR